MPLPRRFQIGEFVINPLQGRVRADGHDCRVEPKAMDVLIYLARHSLQTVSRDEVLRSVWPNSVVTEQVLSRCISQLRKALRDTDASPKLIQTFYKRGYRLAVKAVFDSDQDEPPASGDAAGVSPAPTQTLVEPALELTFAQIFSHSSDHVYLYDRECRYVFANASGARALGLAPGEMIGRHWRELGLMADVLEPFETEVMHAFDSAESTVRQVFYDTVFGRRLYEYVLDPVSDATGKNIAVLAIVRDVTDRSH